MDYVKEGYLIRIERDSPFFPSDWPEWHKSAQMVMPKAWRDRYAESIRVAENVLWPWVYQQPEEENENSRTEEEKRKEGEKALKELQHQKAIFFGFLVQQCEIARAYKFPEKHHRDFDKRAVNSRAAAATAATKLARILRNYQQPYAFPICHSILETGVHLRTVEDERIDPDGLIELEGYGCFPDFRSKIPVGMVGGGPAYSVRLAELLEAFSGAIKRGELLAQRGPFDHRFRWGPLAYPEPKEGRKQETPTDETCLAVFLSFLTRRFTANRGRHWWPGRGYKLTSDGEPLFQLVEELVSDALGHRPARTNIDLFQTRNPDVTVCGYY